MSYEEFLAQRAEFVSQEESRALGADVVLTEDEQKVNEYVMKLKKAELDAGFKSPINFAPSQHFFKVLDQIKNSALFQLIQKMPKGGILHAHDTAIGSMEPVIKATYQKFLWQNGEFDRPSPPRFKFSKTKPEPLDEVEWRSVADVRKELGNEGFDENLRSLLTLFVDNPEVAYPCVNHAWGRFFSMFISLEPLITFKPVWEEYYTNTLKELYADNVTYLEFRGVLPPVYDLDNRVYSPEEVVQIYYDLSEKFKKEHPDFVGVKFIYAPIRAADDATFDGYLLEAENLHKKFPTFVAGFDLVGQEDLGRPLTDFNERLLKLSSSIQFFFHAGETNWNGMTDDNMVSVIFIDSQINQKFIG